MIDVTKDRATLLRSVWSLVVVVVAVVTTRECGVVMSSVASVCLSVSLCSARKLIFDMQVQFQEYLDQFRIGPMRKLE